MKAILARLKSPIFIYPLVLSLLGLLFLSLSSLPEAFTSTGDKYFFLKKQSLWLGISLVVMQLTASISSGTLKKLASPLFVTTILLLLFLLAPGIGRQALGARRWLDFGYFSIQPSELIKISSIVFFAKLFSQEKTRQIKYLLVYLLPPIALILAEPSLSNAIIIFFTISILFYCAQGNLLHLTATVFFSLLLITGLILLSPYRLNRLKTLMQSPEASSANSYHADQLALAIGSGGLIGKGFANSDQKYNFIPKISTDSIFSVIAEETGFIGCLVIILIYLLIINYLLKMAQNLQTQFESLVIVGLAWLIGFQALINLSAVVSLIPITGVPLPFISYGGSSLFVLFAGLGLAQGIKQRLLVYSNNEPKTSPGPHRHHRQSPHPRHRTN
jgi:cell division protein FtsW